MGGLGGLFGCELKCEVGCEVSCVVSGLIEWVCCCGRCWEADLAAGLSGRPSIRQRIYHHHTSVIAANARWHGGIIIHHPSCIIHHQTSVVDHPSSNIIKHHQTPSNIIKHHQTPSNIIIHHQTSSNIIKHHQTSSNIRARCSDEEDVLSGTCVGLVNYFNLWSQ